MVGSGSRRKCSSSVEGMTGTGVAAIVAAPFNELVELCALGLALLAIRFFRSLFGAFLSASSVGDREKKPETLRSRDCPRVSDGCRTVSMVGLSCVDMGAGAGFNETIEACGVVLGTRGEGGAAFFIMGLAMGMGERLSPIRVPMPATTGDGDPVCLVRRAGGRPGDFFEGTVLLL